MIVCLYIDVSNMSSFVELEYTLKNRRYAFYNATDHEELCSKETLEEIECQYEGK